MAKALTIPRKLWRELALIGLPCLLLVAAEVYQAAAVLPDLRRSNELVAHTAEVVSAARALDESVQDAERGQRGYIITGDPAYLEPYEAGVREAPARLAELRQLTADNPDQQRRIGLIEDQVKTRFEVVSRTIEARRTNGFEAAREIVQNNVGNNAMRAFTGLVDFAIRAEQALLQQRQARALDAQTASFRLSLVAGALAFAVMALGITLLVLALLRVSRTQSVLEESEARFRHLVEGVEDYAIMMLDPAGRVASWNRGSERMKGFRAHEIIGRPYSVFYTAEDADAGIPARMLDRAADEGRVEAEGWRVRKDGSRFWASAVIAALYNEAGKPNGFAKITHDMTERRQQQEALDQSRLALAQAQKMEAVGQLTGGVAHDFNNLLTTISGTLELLDARTRGARDDRSSQLLAAAQLAGEHGAALTQRLLAFSRKQVLEPKIVDVNKLVSSMSELIRRTLGESILIQAVLAGGLWQSRIDPNQLESALLNLAVNARDAMPEGGKLTIETGNTYLDEDYAKANPEVAPGQYVMVAVSDSGSGMPQEVLARAFEPFFTTKPEGKGTGLGLSQVYGFIKQSGGHIKLYSEARHGTVVKLYLPRSLDADATVQTPIRPRFAARMTGELILLVEDDDGVRGYSAQALEHLGYRVLEAADADSALQLLDNHSEIRVLFTDVGLPGRNGRQLAKEALKRAPDLQILYTTGYTRNAIVHQGILDAGVELLPKPFTVEALGQKLHQMLHAPFLPGPE